MPKRWFPCMAALLLVTIALPARAADAKPAGPALIVRLKSLDGLIADAKFLATEAGKEEEAKQADEFLKGFLGGKGFKGIDTKQPIAFYGTLGPNLIDSTGVGMIPVTDEKAVLDLLDSLNYKATKGTDGIYTIPNVNKSDNAPVDVYFRFANKYAYVTARDKSALSKDKLIEPSKLLPAEHVSTLAVTLRLDQIPDEPKKIALTQFERQLANEKEKKNPGETDAQHTFKVQVLDTVVAQVASVVNDGNELTLRFDVEHKKKNMLAELSLTGKDGSKLATSITDLAQSKSLFAGIPGRDSAMTVLLHLAVSQKLREALAPVIDEGVNKGLNEEKDPAKRAQAEKVVKAILPSLKAGELDAIFDMSGPSADKLYTLAIGVKLKDGLAIEKILRDALKDLPEADRAKVKMDVEKVGAVGIHEVDGLKQADADTKRMLGDGPAYFAIRNNAVLITAGAGALAKMKSVLAAEPQPGKPFQFTMSMSRIAELIAKDQKSAPKIAELVFATDKDSDKIRFTFEGGKALRLRLDLNTTLIKFFTMLEEEKKKGQN